MSAENPTEEQSIKSRKAELFDAGPDPASTGPRKPFREYLKTTPPAPLPGWLKALLWALGIAAALLFAAALAKAPRRAEAPSPAAPAGARGG